MIPVKQEYQRPTSSCTSKQKISIYNMWFNKAICNLYLTMSDFQSRTTTSASSQKTVLILLYASLQALCSYSKETEFVLDWPDILMGNFRTYFIKNPKINCAAMLNIPITAIKIDTCTDENCIFSFK